jgi:hypothetical protein
MGPLPKIGSVSVFNYGMYTVPLKLTFYKDIVSLSMETVKNRTGQDLASNEDVQTR